MMSGNNLWCRRCKSHHHAIDDCVEDLRQPNTHKTVPIVVSNGSTPKGERMPMTQDNFYKRIEIGEACIDDLRSEISKLKSKVNNLQNRNKHDNYEMSGAGLIEHLVRQVQLDGNLCYDSAITSKLRELSANGLANLVNKQG